MTACTGVDFDDPVDEVQSSINGHVDPVRVHAILTANDDGSQAATATPADIQDGIAKAKTILAAAGIELTFDPESDISRMNSTLLDHDCTPIPGADLSDQKTQPQSPRATTSCPCRPTTSVTVRFDTTACGNRACRRSTGS